MLSTQTFRYSRLLPLKTVASTASFRLYSLSIINGPGRFQNKREYTVSNNKQPRLPIYQRVKNATTFTASTALVIGATGISAIVIYLILAELFSPSGDTRLFNRAVSIVEQDSMVRQLLQCNDSALHNERLKSYGELFTNDRWTRNRPISSSKKIDRKGRTHFFMQFHIESKKKIGLVHLEAKEPDVDDGIDWFTKLFRSKKPIFTSMYIDVPGAKRYYLVKPKLQNVARPGGFLGINWGPRK